jgi:hypothetical protein
LPDGFFICHFFRSSSFRVYPLKIPLNPPLKKGDLKTCCVSPPYSQGGSGGIWAIKSANI